MTIRESIMEVLTNLENPITATNIKIMLGNEFELSSVSSLLKRMVDDGTIERIENHGPRGGYGYSLKDKNEDH